MQIDKNIQKAFDLQLSKKYLAAEKIYKTLYKKYSDNTTLLTLYGILKIQIGDYKIAIELLEKSLLLDTKNEITLSNLGIVFFNIGKYRKSISYLNKAINLNPNNHHYFYHIGNSFRKLKFFNMALNSYKSAINLKRDDIQTLFSLANTYQEINLLNEALFFYKKIFEFENLNIQALFSIGDILFQFNKFEEAINFFDRVIEIDTLNLDALFKKAISLSKLNNLLLALDCYTQILKINNNDINTLINRGLILRNLGFYNQAYKDFKRVLKIEKNNYGALFNISLLKLLEGNYSEGFKLYEFRKNLGLGRYRFSSKPVWLNNFSIKNKTLLIHSDQGLGDFIQCYRYIEFLKDFEVKLILLTPPSLTKIIQEQNENILIVEEGQAIPDFDFECPIMSLPYAFNTTLDSIPAKFPYLKINKVIEKLSNNDEKILQKIGVAWRGSPNHDDDSRRSIDIEMLTPIFMKKYEFHIIQKSLTKEEHIFLNQFDNIIIHSEDIHNFYDTAIIVNKMDFIISVDTSVAHLAGALNKKVHLLLSFSPDFRWLLNNKSTRWYPSFNIIRQEKFNDWQSVIDNLIKNYL